MIVTLVFDEGPGAGLGHRRRLEALAAELTAREHVCHLVPLSDRAEIAVEVGGDSDVTVVDSYRCRADDTERFPAAVVVAIDDLARDLAVDVVVDPSPGASGARHRQARLALAGVSYALVPALAADVAPVPVEAPVERVLVTTGASDAAGVGAGVAAALHAALPAIEVRLVLGPWGAGTVPAGVVAIDSPDGLAGELAAAAVVVTAGGVTMLEACRLGRPVVALELAANQHQAVAGLALAGAVVAATVASAAEAVAALVDDRRRRLALAAAAAGAVDGKGAARVADAIEYVVMR